MRLAHIADLHLRSGGIISLPEQYQMLNRIGNDAAEQGAAAILVAGDVFDRSASEEELNIAIDVFSEWSSKMEIVVVYGNHDRPGSLYPISRLKTRGKSIHVADLPKLVTISDRGESCVVACLPYPNKAGLAWASENALDQRMQTGSAKHALLQSMALGNPDIVLGHLELESARTDSNQPMTGKCCVEIFEHDLLEIGAQYYALGHIHKEQLLALEQIAYAGSPWPTSFGSDVTHGYRMIDLSQSNHSRSGSSVRSWFVPTPGCPRLITVDLGLIDSARSTAYDGDALDAIQDFQFTPGDAIKLRYEVDSVYAGSVAADVSRIRKALLGSGARYVVCEPRVTIGHRARSDTFGAATTLREKLKSFWASEGKKTDMSERVFEKLDWFGNEEEVEQ